MADQAYIARLQNGINSNNQNINVYRGRITDLRQGIRNNQQRISALERIRNTIYGFSGTADGIVNKQRSFSRTLEGAARAHAHTGEVIQAVDSDSEPALSSDRRGIEMIDSINREIQRCQQEISDAENRVNSYQDWIVRAQEANNRMNNAIREERKKK